MNDQAAVLTNFAAARVLVRISSGSVGTSGGTFKVVFETRSPHLAR